MSMGAPSRFALRFIATYQDRIAPGSGHYCPFEPSCSEYGRQAYGKYGFFRATGKTVGRLLRCRPGYEGSYIDPP